MILVFLFVLLFAAPASAAVHVVTNTNDNGAGSLREVLFASVDPGDTIVFSLPASPQVINLSNEIGLKEHVTLLGPGAERLTIRQTVAQRVFNVDVGVDVTIAGLTIEDGVGQTGGGINHLGGALTLSNVVLRNNTATGGAARGGGLYVSATSGPVRLISSVFDDNDASIGAGVAIHDGTADVVIEACTFMDNDSGDGAGLYHGGDLLSVSGSRFVNNTATTPGSGGGGIFISASAGDFSISTLTFTNNHSIGDAGMGGAIAAVHLEQGQVATVDRCLFDGNSGQIGAAITFAEDHLVASVRNSTFTAHAGPALAVFSTGVAGPNTVYVSHCTFAANLGAAILTSQQVSTPNTVYLRNNLFGGNVGDLAGLASSFVSVGHNLSVTAHASFNAFGDAVVPNPELLALADNGGPTFTFALAATSPAIDAGDCGAFEPVQPLVTIDQRGAERPGGTACDVGAFERVSLPVGPTGPTGPMGTDGAAGENGADGMNGANGSDGADGMNGSDGADGMDGNDGADGAVGATGPTGADGERVTSDPTPAKGCASTTGASWLIVCAFALMRRQLSARSR